MAITNSTILDLVPSEKVLAGLVAMGIPAANELVAGGVMLSNADMNARAADGGPRKMSIPFLNPLATTAYNIGNDDITDAGDVGKLTASEFDAVRHVVNYGWGSSDLATMVTKYDAKGGVAAGIAAYWAGVQKAIAIASLKGALGADANLTHDTAGPAFDMDLVVEGIAAKKGVNGDILDTMIVSPTVYALMQKGNLANQFVAASDSNLRFDTFAGFKLVRTASDIVSTTKVVLCGQGTLAYGQGAHLNAIEIERVANGGNGAGADILHSRQSFIIHPQGFDWVGASNAPDLTALATASNYDLAVAHDQIALLAVDFAA